MKKKIGFIAMSGVRAQNAELLAAGLTLPGFIERSKVIASLPSLSLLTLAGLTPARFDVEYHEIADLQKVVALELERDTKKDWAFFRKAAEEVQDAIDCRQCAECCRVTEVQITDRDAEKLAKFLGMSVRQFFAEHATEDSDGDGVYDGLDQCPDTPPGMKVRIYSELVAVEGRNLTFKVWAEDEQEPIGEGMHYRVVIDLPRFEAKVARKAASGH